MQEGLRPVDTQILKVGKWRFAEHFMATPLQSTRARRQRRRRFLQREPALSWADFPHERRISRGGKDGAGYAAAGRCRPDDL